MRLRPLALLLALVLASPAAAAVTTPETWGFTKVAEWPLGTGENALGCRPADPADPPNAEYLWGDGPMLVSAGIVADPVNRRQFDVARGTSFPYMLGKDPKVRPEAYRSLAGETLVVAPGSPTVFTGETLEARLLGSTPAGDVIGVNRIVDGEARALLLAVDPFGAVRDLFELPLVPWPNQFVIDGERAAFLLFRDPAGKRRTLTPYESAGYVELHVAEAFTPALAARRKAKGAAGAKVTSLPFAARAAGSAAYDPVADAWLLVDRTGAEFSGRKLAHRELSAALAGMVGAPAACFGDDGRFHVFDGAGSTAVSFGVTPEGGVEPFRAFALALPPGPPRVLSNPRVTRTGEIFLDDLGDGRTLRFLPDGKPAGMKEGLVDACVTGRGAWALAAGADPSTRPLLEFDLALNFQRKIADLAEPGGRVGTVRLLGLDRRHRLHLVRFRDGLPVETLLDQETGNRLAERTLAFDPPADARPFGAGFFLRHDGAVRVLYRAGDAVTCLDYPAAE